MRCKIPAFTEKTDRFLRRVTAIIVGHVLGALAIAWSVYPLPERITLLLPCGMMFAFFGFPYLAVEIPVGFFIHYVFDRCTTWLARGLSAVLILLLSACAGFAIAPRVGDKRLYPEGYKRATVVFAVTQCAAAILTRQKEDRRNKGEHGAPIKGSD